MVQGRINHPAKSVADDLKASLLVIGFPFGRDRARSLAEGDLYGELARLHREHTDQNQGQSRLSNTIESC